MPTPLEETAIAKSLRQVEVRTGVVMGAVVTPISDAYLGYVLIDAFLLAGLIDGALWLLHLVTDLRYLLLIQLAALVLALIPLFRRWMVSLLPKLIRHHHAARTAVMAFHRILNETPADKDVILFYVSIAERYVHILHSRSLNNKIDKSIWQDIVAQYTKVLPKVGLSEATLQAIKNTENALSHIQN